jgi:hypothetical protein
MQTLHDMRGQRDLHISATFVFLSSGSDQVVCVHRNPEHKIWTASPEFRCFRTQRNNPEFIRRTVDSITNWSLKRMKAEGCVHISNKWTSKDLEIVHYKMSKLFHSCDFLFVVFLRIWHSFHFASNWMRNNESIRKAVQSKVKGKGKAVPVLN